MDQAAELFRTNDDHELTTSLKQVALLGNTSRVSELGHKFTEHAEQIQEVRSSCRSLLKGVHLHTLYSLPLVT